MESFEDLTTGETCHINRVVDDIKKHYENICRLCSICSISYIPSISSMKYEGTQLVIHARKLDVALEHIKKKLRKMESEAEHEYHPGYAIASDRELCESLSNYRHDLEFLFRQVQSLKTNV